MVLELLHTYDYALSIVWFDILKFELPDSSGINLVFTHSLVGSLLHS